MSGGRSEAGLGNIGNLVAEIRDLKATVAMSGAQTTNEIKKIDPFKDISPTDNVGILDLTQAGKLQKGEF